MSFILELPASLQKMALVKTASSLWNQSDIRALIVEREIDELDRYFNLSDEWKTIEEEVIKKVEKLTQSHLLKQNITIYVKLMGLEILKWIQCQLRSLRVHSAADCLPPTNFPWTPHGTLDSREMARLIFRNQAVNPFTRYQLAFKYCLEGEVQIVWNSAPEDIKNFGSVDNPTVINEQNLADVWTEGCFWNFPEAGTGSFETSFHNAVKLQNKVAAEYFLERLIPGEKKVCLENALDALDDLNDAELLCFLLSQIEEEQRKRVFQRNSHWIMRHILQWPWTSFFVEATIRYWNSENEDCILPLSILVSEVFYGSKELVEVGIYQELYKELWRRACDRLAADELADTAFAHPALLSDLFEMKDKESIKLIFDHASPASKRNFIQSGNGRFISRRLARANEWDMLEFFMQQCRTSEHGIKQYRKRLHN